MLREINIRNIVVHNTINAKEDYVSKFGELDFKAYKILMIQREITKQACIQINIFQKEQRREHEENIKKIKELWGVE